MAEGAYYIDFRGQDLTDGMKGFDELFKSSLRGVYENLGRSAVSVGRKTLDDAVTPWGVKRMLGRSGGSQFEPYGNSTGRNDSGNMMDSFGYSVDADGAGRVTFSFGWVENQEQYFLEQEEGFKNYGRFKGVTKGGAPRFGRAKQPVETPGANSLTKAYNSISNRISSGVSAAWNEAVRNFTAGGGKSPGTYLQARKAYYESFTGDEVF